MTDREFLHALVVKYYPTEPKQQQRDRCIGCGEQRVLGQRGQGKFKCKKCRKGNGND